MSFARIALLLLVPALTAGCLVVPSKRTTTRVIATGGVELQCGPVGRLVLDAEPTHDAVILSAYRPRECTRARFDVLETRTESIADVELLDGDVGSDVRGLLVLAVIAPATLLVSAAITAVIVRATDDVTTQTRDYSEARRRRSPLPAQGLSIEIVLPSGATAVVMTNVYGRVFFTVPLSEPTRGVLTARVAGAATRTVGYDRDLP